MVWFVFVLALHYLGKCWYGRDVGFMLGKDALCWNWFWNLKLERFSEHNRFVLCQLDLHTCCIEMCLI